EFGKAKPSRGGSKSKTCRGAEARAAAPLTVARGAVMGREGSGALLRTACRSRSEAGSGKHERGNETPAGYLGVHRPPFPATMPVPFPKALYGLALLLGLGGWFDGLFHRPAPVAPAAVREALAARWADARPSLSSPLAPTDSVTRALYAARGFAPLWPAEADRLALRTALAEAHL